MTTPRHSPLVRALPTFAAVFALLSALSIVSAQPTPPPPPPVLVVIEAGDATIDSPRVRAGISARAGVPVASVLELTQVRTRGTLTIAMSQRGRRAQLVYMPVDGPVFAVMITAEAGRPDRTGEWLVMPAVSVIRTSEERRAARQPTSELLDPWLAVRVLPEEQRQALLSQRGELLDPFVGVTGLPVDISVSDYFLGPEVIDPWAHVVAAQREEEARYLSRPRPGRRRPQASPRPPR